MDIIDFIERIEALDSSDSDEEIYEDVVYCPVEEIPQKKPQKIRPPSSETLDKFEDEDFFQRFRMTKKTALLVLDLIEKDLEYESDKNHPISAINQLLICLRFIGSGTFLSKSGDFAGVSTSTASRVVKRVALALQNLSHRFIKFPSNVEEQSLVNQNFYKIASFPNVVGTIGCTHVKILSPGGGDAQLFRNKKGFYSINVQTISLSNLKISYIATQPGSTPDSSIFHSSHLFPQFEQREYEKNILLGDNGYPLKNYLLTPYLKPQTEGQTNYNRAHSTTRNTVERLHSVLKQRFPVLALGFRLKLETTISVIEACAVLHNICVDQNEAVPPNLEDIEALIQRDQMDVQNFPNDERRDTIRDEYVQKYFS